MATRALYAKPLEPSASHTSDKSEMSPSDLSSESAVKPVADSISDDSAPGCVESCELGTPNGPAGFRPSRIFGVISPISRSSVAQVARSYKSGIMLPGAQCPNFSRPSREYKSFCASVARRERGECNSNLHWWSNSFFDFGQSRLNRPTCGITILRLPFLIGSNV